MEGLTQCIGMNQSLTLQNLYLWQMFQEHYTTANKEGTDPVVRLFEINEREAVKQGKSSISLFYPPGCKCPRGPNLST